MVDISINRIREVTTPARAFLFDIILPAIPGAAPPRVMATRVVSSSLPDSDTAEIDVHYMGYTKKIPGVTTFGNTWAVKLLEDQSGIVYRYIEAWKRLYSDYISGRVAMREENYKRDVPIRLLDGNGNVINEYLMHGVYPKTMGSPALSYSEKTGTIDPDITFSYDWWELA